MRDQERYLEYVRARTPVLRRTAYLLCGDWHRAEDAVQNTLVKLYRRPPREWDSADSWVRTTLVRSLADEHRRPWRRERSAEVMPEVAVTSGEPGDRVDLLAALRTLPRQQRAVVVLRFWDDLSVEQTADALGISPGSVKSHSSRGLAALRGVMERSEA